MKKSSMAINIKLFDLVKETGGLVEILSGRSDVIIHSVEYDSRKVKSGSLFIAVEGFKRDGHAYVNKAVESGAAAVVVSKDRISEFSSLKNRDVAVLVTHNTRKALSRISAAFYKFPSRNMTLIGVTGTNGKTSITYMLESIMKANNVSSGVIGTVNYRWLNNELPAPNTTPESKDIQELLYTMKCDGVGAVIMEVSSHALELNRVDDIDFDVAVFTNLTRDHLDFHKNFDDYFNAKKKLFGLLEKSGKKKKSGLVNVDDEYGKRIINDKSSYTYSIISFGVETGDAHYRPIPESIKNRISGLSYVTGSPIHGLAIDLHLSGKFHVYNSLAAIAVSNELNIQPQIIQEGLHNLITVPGRFDVVKVDAEFNVVVDYAHTSDALLKLLQSVNELDHNRVVTVFGCGGDRDRTKRPIMGKIAQDNSDLIIVTSDNPRTEDPHAIIKEIVSGLDGKNFEVIPDREEAIKKAVSLGQRGDIIVIAGKGHEDYQELGSRKIHFDDREIVLKYIREGKAV